MNHWPIGIGAWGWAQTAIELATQTNVGSSDSTITYDSVAPHYARHRSGHAFVAETLHDLQAKFAGGPAMEIGCGTGVYAAALTRTCARFVFGMDPSRQMLRRAAKGKRLAYLQGRATSLPFADQSLGTIFSVNVIHHLDSVDGYFREAFRALKPGGILCTATDSPAIIARRRPLSHYWPATIPVELDRYHSLETLSAEMTQAGFTQVEKCEGRSEFTIADSGAYRDKAFSCLQLIPEADFARGLRAMETDLRLGPLTGVSELVFLSAKRA
jgi:SAM-dependent methyltransferase